MDKADDVLRHKVYPILLGSIVASWVLTSFLGAFGLLISMMLGLGGYFSIWYFVLRPRAIGAWMFVLTTINALQFKNPIKGALNDTKALIGTTAQIGAYFLFVHFVLWTWPFHNNPLAFWGVFAAVIILSSFGPDMGIRKWIIWGYTMIAGLAMLYSTLPGVVRGEVFDPETGISQYMVDPKTGQMDSEGRTPKECATTKCYSTQTGQVLQAMTAEQAMKRNLPGWAAIAAEEAETAKAAAGAPKLDIPWALIGAIMGGLVILALLARLLGGSVGSSAASGFSTMLRAILWIAGALFALWLVILAYNWASSDAKAAGLCQAEDTPPWVMKLDKLRTLAAGCTSYRVSSKLLPYDTAGIKPLFSSGSPDVEAIEEVVTISRESDHVLILTVSETEMKRRGLTTMRFGFCGKPAGSDRCDFPEVVAEEKSKDAAFEIDLEKAEAALAIP